VRRLTPRKESGREQGEEFDVGSAGPDSGVVARRCLTRIVAWVACRTAGHPQGTSRLRSDSVAPRR
jgi:hypothetical protein